jgi:mRNA interferase MazF
LVRFPYSDLTNTKLRPAIVLANAEREDWVLCQVTSQPYADTAAIKIESSDFSSGSLNKTSFARPAKLFTANEEVITKQIGELNDIKFEEILNAVISLFKAQTHK